MDVQGDSLPAATRKPCTENQASAHQRRHGIPAVSGQGWHAHCSTVCLLAPWGSSNASAAQEASSIVQLVGVPRVHRNSWILRAGVPTGLHWPEGASCKRQPTVLAGCSYLTAARILTLRIAQSGALRNCTDARRGAG
jgi:hypothetical protein